ncbi:CLUMA_CG019939, isoform A [Clunio marinus]|uniref:CLUMA_CG019939, isoform A n=1 Tax=Clunio marinus TaxID=568069 RepID=A0A1J1J260_9DIPT|nr:CLUMA_CG019939, isoform A [Clunio marinus]
MFAVLYLSWLINGVISSGIAKISRQLLISITICEFPFQSYLNIFTLLIGESFTLGEKRSCVWLWEAVGRRRRRKQKNRVRLESISEDSLEPVTFTSNSPQTSFWRMWDVGTVPGRLGDAIGILVRYAHQSIATILCPM